MLYHVIIALNGAKKRRVGEITTILERKGLELLNIRKKTMASDDLILPDFKLFILRNQIVEFNFVEFYRKKFKPFVLEQKFNYFLRNHVELFFESENKIFDPYNLWQACRETFESDRKVPIMLVVTSNDANGEMNSFIPDNF